MTVEELIKAGHFCDTAQIVVRSNGNGQWIQGYLIGKNIDIYPAFCRSDWNEYKKTIPDSFKGDERKLLKGQEVDGFHGLNLPMKLIKKSVEQLPDNVARLQVCSFQPRHIPSYHREQLFHNEYELEISCYPDDWQGETIEKVKDTCPVIEGQMDINDFI